MVPPCPCVPAPPPKEHPRSMTLPSHDPLAPRARMSATMSARISVSPRASAEQRRFFVLCLPELVRFNQKPKVSDLPVTRQR